MKNAKPVTFVIFGGTGDLARNKIFNAIYDLDIKDCLPSQYRIVGFSRKDMSDEDYREFVRNSLADKEVSKEFLKHFHYSRGDIKDLETYEDLGGHLNRLDDEFGVCSNKVYYLAVPPNLYEPVFDNLDKADLILPCDKDSKENWTRILVEKPFGSNQEEAEKLDMKLGKMFNESQIFRIDHYLAKDAVQNLLFFRFANPIFNPVWNREYVEKVEINIDETNDASERGHFYDSIGALYDMGQSHILQMLSLVAMDEPVSMTSNEIREKREAVLKKITPWSKKVEEYAYRAQYEGYRSEEGVDPESDTDTFFQLKLEVNDRRWKGVPFYLRSGKALKEKSVRIKIYLKESKSNICPVGEECHYGNDITIDIQPERKIKVKFWSKVPGLSSGLEERDLVFEYGGDELLTDAYEKVLFDAIMGDQTLFTTTNEVSMQWGIIKKICKDWQNTPLDIYPKGADVNGLLRLD